MKLNKHQHFKIYKPFNMLSQFASNSTQQKRKRFLGELGEFPVNTMPIGRLDEKSEGLLLLTTDGKLSNFINISGIEKEYYVLVDGVITEAQITTLQNGVEIGFDGKKYLTKSCKIFKLDSAPILPERSKKIRDARHGPTSWVSITITEGKFRQIRKMTSAVGCPTLRLVRVRVGNIKLKNMQSREVKALDIPNLL